MNVKRSLIRLYTLGRQFGIDPRRFLYALRAIPAFVRDYRRFRRVYEGVISLNPQLHDRDDEGGVTKSEYFWQDLMVARWINEAGPEMHVDVGSRLDGFVAHVASFREIEVFDVRPVSTQIPNVMFKQADLMAPESIEPSIAGGGYCDSLSCLHVLEHFGLGRYGDPVDPGGYQRGFANLASLLKPGGRFYLSTPIGKERVEFNANWVFDPRTVLGLAERHGLPLSRFLVFSAGSGLREIDTIRVQEEAASLAEAHYHLAIFVFTRPDGRQAGSSSY